MGGIRVPERPRDVADLPFRVSQHPPCGLEAHLLDDAGVRQARPAQAALQRARAGPHRFGDEMHVERATGKQCGDDLPHATVEVAGIGTTCRRASVLHVILDPGGQAPVGPALPVVGRILHCREGTVLPFRAVPRHVVGDGV